MGDINQIGLVAGTSIEDYENDVIKKHEHTRANKEADRIKHVDTLNANTGPVFLTYPAREEINSIIEKEMQNTPVYDFEAEDGIKHIFWVISDEEKIEKPLYYIFKVKCIPVAEHVGINVGDNVLLKANKK